MSPNNLELFEINPDDEGPWDDAWSALCGCGEGSTPRLEIDSGDVIVNCSTCGKSLFQETDLVFLEPTPVDVECVQEHDHHWDTYGCDCNFYYELKTTTPKE